MRKSLNLIFCLLAFLLIADSVHAATFLADLDFSAPTQSLWGGGTSLGFGSSGSTGGAIGISYDVGASTGTVEGNFNGMLKADYQPILLSPGTTNVDVGFEGDVNGGLLKSDLGAWLNVSGYVDIDILDVSWDILDYDWGLNVKEIFTPAIGTKATGSDDLTLFDVGVGFEIVEAGVNINIYETLELDPHSVNGVMVYKNKSSSFMGSTNFSLTSGSPVSVAANLNQVGVWDLWFIDLSLFNTLTTDFDLTLNPYIDYFFGDWETTLAGIDLYNNSFALDFDKLSTSKFTISIVPEPGTIFLFGIGILGLACMNRKNAQMKKS